MVPSLTHAPVLQVATSLQTFKWLIADVTPYLAAQVGLLHVVVVGGGSAGAVGGPTDSAAVPVEVAASAAHRYENRIRCCSWYDGGCRCVGGAPTGVLPWALVVAQCAFASS